MESKYIEFNKNDSGLFDQDPNQIDKKADRFVIPDFSFKHWFYSVSNDWIYVMNKDEKDSPDQGWKIHLTAVPEEAQELLYVVADYLLTRGVSFKFVPTVVKLIEKNSKTADRSSSGKFITIYPHDETTFVQLLDKLDKLTHFFTSGPYILNDKQWKEGNVFFRYGGFKEMILKQNGEKIDAIKDPNGKLIPDKRVPYYYLPEFVTEPAIIQAEEQDQALNDTELSEFDKYQITYPITFSNAGGIYKARIADKQCVLKEGRPKAGLDGNNNDGFYRILLEYRTLVRLKDNTYVVNVSNYFTAWKHNYLVEDFATGVTLDEFIATNFPFNNITCKPETSNKYLDNAILIIEELIKAIKSIHAQGIAMGDLQPGNVIFSEADRKITLIDFEEAANPKSKFASGLITDGFASREAQTFGEADWFAIGKIAYHLFIPISAANSSLSPDIKSIYDERISLVFGEKAIKFLKKVMLEISRHTNVDGAPLFMEKFLKLPGKRLTKKNKQYFITELRNGIANHLDFTSSGLIKGNVKQYQDTTSRYSVEYGAFGGIMTLMRSGGINDEIVSSIENWFLPNYSIISSNDFVKSSSYGLFDGLAGISSVLYDLGQADKATKLLQKINLADVGNVSLLNGVSGIGLAFLGGYLITGNTELLQSCYQAADIVKANFEKRTDVKPELKDTGLLNGLAGEALFLYKLGEKTQAQKFKKLAINIIDYIIKHQLKYDQDGNLFVNDTSRKVHRLIPYLNDGSAGIAIVMLIIYQDQESFLTNNREKVLRDLISATFSASTVEAGIFDGYAGFLILGNLINLSFKDDRLLNYTLDGMNMYLFSNGLDEIYLSGERGLKCSMDVATGASGLILALLGIDTDKWYSFLPIPLSAKIF
ncbi:class III lanthionine synthetase LanKC [Lactobacillus sp. ESL0791]|uniref:class III lanthionine synthetase LanKC n=1 Tax=Lactobacillus sp. ESL0791 TaxID=2983234 RepID=UPI0023F6A985|nr:class III lanthionine synthetase LanKC [Lactobacillus sp. ESL0791]MDF7637964.1 class III lanthionine synthetase LanKC [Lactobacillus sp. ESL0791]